VEIRFDRRYRGPLTSANGGFACGTLAGYLDAEEVEVTLRRPPPLERPLAVRPEGDAAFLLDGSVLVAEARPATVALEAPEPVPLAEAERAAARHVPMGLDVFRECFVCGVRDEADGLGIHAGAVEGRDGIQAAPWTPRESSAPIVWAAIDCPGAYAVGTPGRGELVLGRMTARVERVPEVGERCVVVAWPLGQEGRKLFAGTALLAEDGRVLAVARQVWIEPARPFLAPATEA
jgi:hypothetical protein